MAYNTPTIVVSYDHVLIENHRMEKPAAFGAMEWMRFWEEVQHIGTDEDLEDKCRQLQSEVDDLKQEVADANQELSEARAEIRSLNNQLTED